MREQYEWQDAHAHDLDDDDDEIQHPCFFTTSRDPSSWKVYEERDASFFVYVHKRMQQKTIANDPLLRPYNIAFDYVKKHKKDLFEKEMSKMELAKKGNLAEIEQQTRENVQSLYKWLFDIDTSCSRPRKSSKKVPVDNLAKEELEKLKQKLPICVKKDKIDAGVYVFPGYEPDCSASPRRGG